MSTSEKYARAVGRKGIGQENEMDWLVKDMSLELKAWGHAGGTGSSIILKADGERSIGSVRDAIAKFHGGVTIPEASAKNESQSNGRVEEAGKTVREFARVMKEQLDDNAKITLECDSVIVLWMVRWAAMMTSRYLVGKDGRTAYERRRGRKCKVPVVMFGEKVWYKEVREGTERKDKFNTEWKEGVWLGHARNTNEAIIGTDLGALRAYAVKRRAPGEQWDGPAIQNLKGTPQQPDPN